jgi:hypothetical protein
MFLGIGIVLIIIWICAFFLLHVTSFLIHLLIILGVISLIMHFARGRQA